jgi:hypothetical protein
MSMPKKLKNVELVDNEYLLFEPTRNIWDWRASQMDVQIVYVSPRHKVGA